MRDPKNKFLVVCLIVEILFIFLRVDIVYAKVTAYCSRCEECCGEFADGITSIGRDANKTLGVAVDPKIIPYWSLVGIPGVGFRRADDTGGEMRKSAKKGIWHIDLRFHDHQDAVEFGVQWKRVLILKGLCRYEKRIIDWSSSFRDLLFDLIGLSRK